nr:hypothetical protein [Tanacetum cinerariifolium]
MGREREKERGREIGKREGGKKGERERGGDEEGLVIMDRIRIVYINGLELGIQNRGSRGVVSLRIRWNGSNGSGGAGRM